ncbi:MAG: hypothetical protein LBD23_07945 [Oscillospiraceae bacterium]|jgi:uncharacterized protein YukE|nr:hypothetical protein [Oscillospiraceae bacterium]
MIKKEITILLLLLFFVFFLSNCSFDFTQNEPQSEVQGIIYTTIAVVNADMGVDIDGDRLNYSAAIISSLDANYVLVSPAVAESGYESGAYGAIMKFPADVSERIISFNAQQPEHIEIEYMINSNLSETDYINMYIKIMNLQVSINTTLAHTYVSSIYLQFHKAQDHLDMIFRNNTENQASMDVIRLPSFSSALNLDSIPDIPLDTTSTDSTKHIISVNEFAGNVSSLYLNSYNEATQRYLTMREGLFDLIDDLPDQENSWMLRLAAWAETTDMYGDDLLVYTNALEDYADTLLEAWYIVREWFGDADEWHSSHRTSINGAIEYLSELVIYIDYLYTNFEVASVSLQEWYDTLTSTFDAIQQWHDSMDSAYNTLQEFRDDVESASTELQDWHDDLTDVHDELQRWHGDIEDAYDDVNGWYNSIDDVLNEMEEWHKELETTINDFRGWYGILVIASSKLQEKQNVLEMDYKMLQAWYEELEDHADITDLPTFPSLTFNEDFIVPKLEINYMIPEMYNDFIELKRDAINVPEISDDFVIRKLADDFTIPSLENGFNIPQPEDYLTMPEIIDDVYIPTADNIRDRPEGALPILTDIIDLRPLNEEVPELSAIQPTIYSEKQPPRPSDFWVSINGLNSQLSEFDVGAYLSNDIHQQASMVLGTVDNFLVGIGYDLDTQFDINTNELHNVRHEYIKFLSLMKDETLRSEADEHERFRSDLDEIILTNEGNNENTHHRLSDFANMMPESRTQAGMNSDLVDFTVAPLLFISPELRQAVFYTEVEWEHPDSTGQNDIIIIAAAITIVILPVITVLVMYYRKRKRKL